MLGFHFPALSALQEDDCFSFHSELPTEKHVVSTVMIYDITYIYIYMYMYDEYIHGSKPKGSSMNHKHPLGKQYCD